MKEIEVRASRSYRVMIGEGLLSRAGELAAPLIEGRRALIAAGETAAGLYAGCLRESLEKAGFEVVSCTYPSGEAYKTPETLVYIINTLAEHGFTRSDAVFALGGGVTGDMAGLAAALYQRGIACVLLPTTLLAAVDASVGGKTAVDLPAGKNLMGVFAQPRLVLCDPACFSTLPEAVRAEGWAEIIKCAALRGGRLLELLQDGEADRRLEEIIALCVELKRELVERDEYDRGERRLLNFGHTIGHAIEKLSAYAEPHGRAVAAGMAITSRAACAAGICDTVCVETLEKLLDRFGLPKNCAYAPEALLAAVRADKKRSGERITMALPRRFGDCGLFEMDWKELGELIARGV